MIKMGKKSRSKMTGKSTIESRINRTMIVDGNHIRYKGKIYSSNEFYRKFNPDERKEIFKELTSD